MTCGVEPYCDCGLNGRPLTDPSPQFAFILTSLMLAARRAKNGERVTTACQSRHACIWCVMTRGGGLRESKRGVNDDVHAYRRGGTRPSSVHELAAFCVSASIGDAMLATHIPRRRVRNHARLARCAR